MGMWIGGDRDGIRMLHLKRLKISFDTMRSDYELLRYKVANLYREFSLINWYRKSQ